MAHAVATRLRRHQSSRGFYAPRREVGSKPVLLLPSACRSLARACHALVGCEHPQHYHWRGVYFAIDTLALAEGAVPLDDQCEIKSVRFVLCLSQVLWGVGG